jgi:hypothetical protein
MKRRIWLVSVVLAILMVGAACAEGQVDKERWYVYSDGASTQNHGFWTNWMPSNAADMLRLSSADTTRPASGRTCLGVDIGFKLPSWCAVAVSCAPSYWGETPSDKAWDLRGLSKLVFSARGKTGGECVQVKVAILGDKRFGDSAHEPAVTPWLRLTKEWQTFDLDVSRLDLTRVVTPFVFATNEERNPGGRVTFYLVEIYFVKKGGK